MKKKLLITFVFILSLIHSSDAQRLRSRWKAYRYEWSAGVGAANFLGDLGGANQIGTHGFKDLELSLTRPALTLGLKYKLAESFALNSHVTYGQVRGDDKLTTEYFRNNRNLNFKSNIYEFNLNFEYAFLSSRQGGIYRLRGVKRNSSFEAQGYVFAGIGVFHFNPKGQYNDKWYELQPLGTEGQGISEGRKKYNRTQVCIPIGVGARYFFNRRMGVGVEFGIRQTFTDYIDDVSKTYYDRNAIAQANGQIAGFLSDPSLDQSTTQTDLGSQRGDARHNDSYMFFTVSFHYKLRTGRTNFPVF
ncbi:MAG: DUF6089 family protein [Bacteroidota bacterium]